MAGSKPCRTSNETPQSFGSSVAAEFLSSVPEKMGEFERTDAAAGMIRRGPYQIFHDLARAFSGVNGPGIAG